MKARKGFVGTFLAVTIALFLFITSAYAIAIGVQTTRQEARITSDMERSLYPLAWSTTNLVLQSLKPAFEADDYTGDASMFFFGGDLENLSSDLLPITFGIPRVASCDVTLFGDRETGIRVSSTAYNLRGVSGERVASGGVYRSVTVKGRLYLDDSVSPGEWKIEWR